MIKILHLINLPQRWINQKSNDRTETYNGFLSYTLQILKMVTVWFESLHLAQVWNGDFTTRPWKNFISRRRKRKKSSFSLKSVCRTYPWKNLLMLKSINIKNKILLFQILKDWHIFWCNVHMKKLKHFYTRSCYGIRKNEDIWLNFHE